MTSTPRERLKLAAIPVLVIALAVAVWPRTEEPVAEPVKKQKLPETAAVASNGSARHDSSLWNVEVDVVRSRNPFAIPRFLLATASPKPPANTAKPRAAPEQIRVDAVLTTQGTTAAVVNGRVVHLGDHVDGGRRVLAISHDTITIGRAD